MARREGDEGGHTGRIKVVGRRSFTSKLAASLFSRARDDDW